jgi:hypothetical protein
VKKLIFILLLGATAYGQGGKIVFQSYVDAADLTKPTLITISALRAASLPQTTGLYQITDVNKEGLFKYDASDIATADDGATVIANGLKRYKRILTGTVKGKWFATGDGTTDDHVGLQTALDFSVANKQRLDLQEATFSIGSSTLNVSGDGLYVFNGQIKGTDDILIQTSGTLTAAVFSKVTFNSTGSTGNVFGLFTSYNKNISGLIFDHCTFTCPTSITNGIKIIDSASDRSRNISITYCSFETIGQIGIEFQNHNHTGEYRYSDINISDNVFRNLGEASIYGMAVSLSGRGERVIIANNRVFGADDIGIELAGSLKDVRITGNILDSLKAGCTPFSFTNSISGTGSDWNFDNVKVIGNASRSDARVNLYRMNGGTVQANTFIFTATTGYLQVKDNTGTEYANNQITTTGQFSIFVTSTAPAVSTGNKFTNNILDNSTSTTNSGVIQFDQVGTSKNICVSNILKKGIGGVYLAESNSAASNVKQGNFNIDPSTGAVAIDAVLVGDIVLSSPASHQVSIGTGNFFYGDGLRNATTSNNASFGANDTGPTISRNVADANPTLVVTNSLGTGDLTRWVNATTTVARFTNEGKLRMDATNTTTGTTGAQTINKPTGTVNVAAAGTSVVVTNSLVSTTSIVYCVVRTNDANATAIKSVVPASGSFTITLTTAPAAEVSIGFVVFN